jgi:hypothetical protein
VKPLRKRNPSPSSSSPRAWRRSGPFLARLDWKSPQELTRFPRFASFGRILRGLMRIRPCPTKLRAPCRRQRSFCCADRSDRRRNRPAGYLLVGAARPNSLPPLRSARRELLCERPWPQHGVPPGQRGTLRLKESLVKRFMFWAWKFAVRWRCRLENRWPIRNLQWRVMRESRGQLGSITGARRRRPNEPNQRSNLECGDLSPLLI